MKEHIILNNPENDIYKILVSEEQIQETVEKIAKKIDEDYAGKNLLLLCILKGSVVFFSDLMRKLTIPLEIDFMKVASYGRGYKTSGNVNIILDLQRENLEECDVLIIEDIIDSGKTLSALIGYLKIKGVRSVKTCTFLDKPCRRTVDFTPDYTGIVIESREDDEDKDKYVVGYGLDYNEKYRELPYVGLLKPSVYLGK